MKRLLVCFAVLLLPGLAFAQCSTLSCGQCYLQLFDDRAMTQVCGTIVPFQPKDVYVGLRLSSPETGFTGVEFSIAGMDGLLQTSQQFLGSMPNLLLGSIPAPPDTTGTAFGGVTIAWPICQIGSQAFMKITVVTFAPVTNKVLRVTHKFPTSDMLCFPTSAVIVRCNPPTFTFVKVNTNLTYVLNADASQQPCGLVPIQQKNWTAIKTLYGHH